jgi:hypothetical protein
MYPLTIAALPFAPPAIHPKMICHEKYQRDPFHS